MPSAMPLIGLSLFALSSSVAAEVGLKEAMQKARKDLSEIKTLEAEWVVIPPEGKDASGKATPLAYSNTYHIWMKGNKIRVEYVLRELATKAAKSKQVTVYDGTTMTALRLPERGMTKKSGADAGYGFPSFPAFRCFQVFANGGDAGSKTAIVLTLAAFADEGLVDKGLKAAALNPGGQAYGMHLISDPFPSVAKPELKVGYGLAVDEKSGWPTSMFYYAVKDGNPSGITREEFSDFKSFAQPRARLPMLVKRDVPKEDGTMGISTYRISDVKLNEDIEDEQFFIDPTVADFTWDADRKKVVSGGKEQDIK